MCPFESAKCGNEGEYLKNEKSCKSYFSHIKPPKTPDFPIL